MKKNVASKGLKKAGKSPSRLEFRVGRLNPKRAGASSSDRYATKKVRGPDGTITMVFTVKTDSKTFGNDLRHAFEKSVEKARRENKQKLGVRDYRIHS